MKPEDVSYMSPEELERRGLAPPHHDSLDDDHPPAKQGSPHGDTSWGQDTLLLFLFILALVLLFFGCRQAEAPRALLKAGAAASPTPPPGWWNCANQCAPCPPNLKPYITYTDPYGKTGYIRFDAGIAPVPPGTCTPRWVGQGGPDHADLGLGADCKYYPLKTGDSTAKWHYPAPPPEANLCAFYPGPEDCPTVDMATYSKRMQSNPVWIESVNTYKPQMDAECKGIAPTFTKGPSWTLSPTSAFPTRTPTASHPDDCILSGRTCTPTPRVSPTSTPTRIAPSAVPTATATASASRFSIAVTWTKPDGTSGSGTPSCLTSSGDLSAGFWFFSPSNLELFVSVLPSYCSTHPNVMVKLFGGTNVKVDVVVTDRQTGKSHTYSNPQGTTFVTVIDTSSLPCN